MPIFIEQIADPAAEDFNDLVKIYTDYPPLDQSPAPGPEQQPDVDPGEHLNRWLRQQLSNPALSLYAARFNGRLLGAVWIRSLDNDQCWALEDLCVRGLTRRRGVASKLLSEILLYARQAGVRLSIPVDRALLSDDLLEALDELTRRYNFRATAQGDEYTWQPET